MRWLALWMVGLWVSTCHFSSSLYPNTTRRDFSYGASVPLPLISWTRRALNMRTSACFRGSYFSKRKTPLPMRASISVWSESSNGAPGVVILPSLRSWMSRAASDFSLSEMNAADVLVGVTDSFGLFFEPLGRPLRLGGGAIGSGSGRYSSSSLSWCFGSEASSSWSGVTVLSFL